MRRRALLAAGLLLVPGCSGPTPPTSFYTLAPIGASSEAVPGASSTKPLTLGVGPVGVAEYLKRPQIVTRTSTTELDLADFDQWVEPFDILFPRVLAQDLATLLATDRISLAPAPRDVRLDNLVEVDVIRFDAMVGEGVVLDALWRIYGRDGDRLLDQGRSRIERKVAAATDAEIPYTEIVTAMSDATGDLARVIADAVEKNRQRR